jgi:hypothetical protein
MGKPYAIRVCGRQAFELDEWCLHGCMTIQHGLHNHPAGIAWRSPWPGGCCDFLDVAGVVASSARRAEVVGFVPFATHGHRQYVIDFFGLACASWSAYLTPMVVALQYLEPYLLPRSGVLRLTSHGVRRPGDTRGPCASVLSGAWLDTVDRVGRDSSRLLLPIRTDRRARHTCRHDWSTH